MQWVLQGLTVVVRGTRYRVLFLSLVPHVLLCLRDKVSCHFKQLFHLSTERNIALTLMACTITLAPNSDSQMVGFKP